MSDELPPRVDVEWRRLVVRLRWTFVEDATQLQAQVLAALHERHGTEFVTDNQIRVELQQHYNQRLYAAFLDGRLNPGDGVAVQQADRACGEIWYAAWRQVLAKGYHDDIAQEVAQRVVMLLIEKPYDVRVPGSLSAWVMWKVLGLLSALRDRPTESSLDSTTSEQPALKDVWDPVEQVEDDMLARELLAELPSLLSPFQLQVIHYIVLEEQSPRHVAALFNVAETRVRVEKSRALQKLRSHLSRQMPP